MFNANTNKSRRYDFDTKLPGTLVLWEIPFRKELNNEHSNDFHN